MAPSGDTANSVQAEGNSNSSLGQLGEDEEKFQQEMNLDEGFTTTVIVHADDEKVVDPNEDYITTVGSGDSRMNSDKEPCTFGCVASTL